MNQRDFFFKYWPSVLLHVDTVGMCSCPGAAVIIIIPPRYSAMLKFTFDLKVPKLMPEMGWVDLGTVPVPHHLSVSRPIVCGEVRRTWCRLPSLNVRVVGQVSQETSPTTKKKRKKIHLMSFFGRKPQRAHRRRNRRRSPPKKPLQREMTRAGRHRGSRSSTEDKNPEPQCNN